jgi:hypothetical protein
VEPAAVETALAAVEPAAVEPVPIGPAWPEATGRRPEPYRARVGHPDGGRRGKRGGVNRVWYTGLLAARREGTESAYLQANPDPRR